MVGHFSVERLVAPTLGIRFDHWGNQLDLLPVEGNSKEFVDNQVDSDWV
jgi:hypothetical protein